MDKIEKMRELIAIMHEESLAYYGDNDPLVSDRQYDLQFDELLKLEKETEIVFSDSPTQKVSGAVLQSLQKVTHVRPMLSADKSKSVDDIIAFAEKAANNDDSRLMISWKEDGLTLILRYKNGHLFQAITRGSDGFVGEDVTHTVKTFVNVPLSIPIKSDVELRGEGIISWKTFEKINETLLEPYSNPRNLASGSVRQLDSSNTKQRDLEFIAFELIEPEVTKKEEQFSFLKNMGFHVVEHKLSDISCLRADIVKFNPNKYDYPVDGLIIEYNDYIFGKSLGSTGHHENLRIALKWEDELAKTIFRFVDFQLTRTGRVSLTAVFDPIQLEGSVVSRATLHNVTFFENLQLGEGDIIEVYKANKIIPAIDENLTRSNTYLLPNVCPCCNSKLEIQKPFNSAFLYCSNTLCPAKQVKKFVHFASRGSFNIIGLSEATLEKFIFRGFIKSYIDIFRIDNHKHQIIELDGFGDKSFDRIWNSIQQSKKITMARFLNALGIPLVGKVASRLIEKHFSGDMKAFLNATNDFDFTMVSGFGEKIAVSLKTFFSDNEILEQVYLLLKEVEISSPAKEHTDNPFFGKTIVVTGVLKNFTRAEIQEKLQNLGAHASESVSSKTDYVVFGDKAGSKLDKAKRFGVKIINEFDFLELLKGDD